MRLQAYIQNMRTFVKICERACHDKTQVLPPQYLLSNSLHAYRGHQVDQLLPAQCEVYP